jgi:hydrogenase expression/formation protein HypC
MCLGVPMKVISIANDIATCEIDGVERDASLMMVDGIGVGDYVLIHAGFAIERLDEEDAQETLTALRAALRQGLVPE